MGYIKKLKNNELVGGTDKTTIYPVTSTEAVFEEVIEDGESNFKSQKFLNNNITGDRINGGTITDYNIAEGTITKGKLSSQVQTMLDEGQKKALTPKGNYNSETEYEALDLVFDPLPGTNSSYISLQTPNVGHPVDENAEGYEEGWWEKTLDGTAVNTAQAAINNKIDQLNTQVNDAIGQANLDIQDLIGASQEALQAATDGANDAAEEARDAASTVESLTALQVADAQIGYFECTDTAASGGAANETKITTSDAIGGSHYVKTVGSHVKVKMAKANTHTAPVYLQFGSNNATRAQVYYNGAAVDASNTWDDEETISVFYDNNVYQASNVQGGGGKAVEEILDRIDEKSITRTYGCTTGGDKNTTLKTAYVTSNSPCLEEGLLTSISGKFANTGNCVFYIGYLDSNNYLVLRRNFTIAVTSGNCTLDVSELGITLQENDYVWTKGNLSIIPCWGVSASVNPKGLTTRNANTMECSVRTDNVYISLNWSVYTHNLSLEQRFDAVAESMSDLQEEIDANTEDIATLQPLIQGKDTTYNYGNTTSGDKTASLRTDYVTSNTPCQERGILSNISGYFTSAGDVRFYIGYLDQNNYLILRSNFVVPVTAGSNNIDIQSMNITMFEGDYLWTRGNSGVLPYWGLSKAVSPKGLTTTGAGTMQCAERTDGVYLCFSWIVSVHKPSVDEMIDDIYYAQEDIKTNRENITILQNNKKCYIDDSVTGITYQVMIRNGAIQLVPMQFSKALVLGNSITEHPISSGKWWGVWGMAATKQEYDFVHILQDGLRVKDAEAVCTGINIAAWERNFSTSLSTLIGENLTSETDLVVIRLGENVTNTPGFAAAIGNLVTYIYSVSPNAKVVITGVFWNDNAKEAAIVSAASANGIDYIKISQLAVTANMETVGHYVYGDDDEIHEITNSGVAIHPSNAGMTAIANTILSSIGYAKVNNTYSLQEVTVGGVTGEMWVLDE